MRPPTLEDQQQRLHARPRLSQDDQVGHLGLEPETLHRHPVQDRPVAISRLSLSSPWGGYIVVRVSDEQLAALADMIDRYLERPAPPVNVQVTLQQAARGKKRRRIVSDPEVAPPTDADEGKAAIKRRMLEGR